jgi:hypothetical protein
MANSRGDRPPHPQHPPAATAATSSRVPKSDRIKYGTPCTQPLKDIEMTTRQVKTTLRDPLLTEFEELCLKTGLNPSALLKLSIRRLAATELYQTTQRQTAHSIE